jgi:hypothetical protein
MTEPKRWIDEGPPEAIGHLLEAASSERPADASLARTLGVLGVGVGVAGSASTAGAALTAASAGKASGVLALGTFAKWGLLATAVTAAGVTGKVMLAEPAAAPSAQRAPMVAVSPAVVAAPTALPPVAPSAAPAVPAPEIEPAAPAVEPAPTALARAVTPSAKSTPKFAVVAEAPLDAERLAEEVALVDQARGALARGDARAALLALDDYDARFTERRFVPEALYLRMESRLKLGQTTEARAIAERLVKRFPSSPHTGRARQVLGQTIP